MNNVLEFLGMAVSVLLLLEEAKAESDRFPCLLVLGDNTSAIAWLFKSGRIAKSSRYYQAVKMIARYIARAVVDAEAQLCSQHLQGVSNVIADILSFEGASRGKIEPLTADCPPDDILTERIHKFHSQIIPSGFEIRLLPSSIESFVVSTLRTIAKSWTQRARQPTRGETDIGDGGKSSSGIGDWDPTPTSIRYPTTRRESSWLEGSSCDTVPSTSTQRAELLQSVRNPWYRRLFEMPLAAWHRRSGNVAGSAPSTSRTESMTQDR